MTPHDLSFGHPHHITSTTYGNSILLCNYYTVSRTELLSFNPLHCITPAKLVIAPTPANTPPPLLFPIISPAAKAAAVAPAPAPPPPGDVILWRARFVSSSFIFCSIRNWARLRLFGCPDILTIRFLVPGAKIPLLEIWMFAPDRCWISVRLRPPGPVNLRQSTTATAHDDEAQSDKLKARKKRERQAWVQAGQTEWRGRSYKKHPEVKLNWTKIIDSPARGGERRMVYRNQK